MKLRFRKALFISIAVIAIIGCSNDDSNGNTVEELEFIGTWELTQITLSSAIDANFDNMVSTNLLQEVDCLSSILILDAALEWESTEIVPSLVSSITGNLYSVSCSEERNQNGNWGVSGSNLFLVGSVNRTFLISGDQLIENIGQDLPGIRTMVYSRRQ